MHDVSTGGCSWCIGKSESEPVPRSPSLARLPPLLQGSDPSHFPPAGPEEDGTGWKRGIGRRTKRGARTGVSSQADKFEHLLELLAVSLITPTYLLPWLRLVIFHGSEMQLIL
eukprot:2243769-Rhodomonas_salina.2